MNIYGEKLKKYIKENKIECEYLCFERTCHTVKDSARAANTSVENIVKNICMIDEGSKAIVAVLKGDSSVDLSKVSNLLNSDVRLAKSDEVLRKTGYPAGGVPSFGFSATFLIDQEVMELAVVYTGAGADNCLVKITPSELHKANKGILAPIRKS